MTYPISDTRYTVERETYQGGKRFVLRFNGEFIAASISYASMVIRATGHRCAANGALVIEEVRA